VNDVIAMSAVLLSVLLQSAVPPLRSVEKGAESQVEVQRQATVRNAAEWTSLWHAHSWDRPEPAIDFSREMVVGVFMGSRPTAGFGIEIVGYRNAGDGVVVQYRETMPDRGTLTAQVLVSPYHLVAIPRQAGVVTFEKLPSTK
jgi:hypothetical protein